MKKLRIVAVLMLAFMSMGLSAQMTTSDIRGRVKDEAGAPLLGGTVVATEVSTGVTYATVTDLDGYYNLPNLNPGGPYTLSIIFVGFEPFVKKGIYLNLGQSMKINATIRESAYQLEGV